MDFQQASALPPNQIRRREIQEDKKDSGGRKRHSKQTERIELRANNRWRQHDGEANSDPEADTF
jgi:hypothetical protein